MVLVLTQQCELAVSKVQNVCNISLSQSQRQKLCWRISQMGDTCCESYYRLVWKTRACKNETRNCAPTTNREAKRAQSTNSFSSARIIKQWETSVGSDETLLLDYCACHGMSLTSCTCTNIVYKASSACCLCLRHIYTQRTEITLSVILVVKSMLSETDCVPCCLTSLKSFETFKSCKPKVQQQSYGRHATAIHHPVEIACVSGSRNGKNTATKEWLMLQAVELIQCLKKTGEVSKTVAGVHWSWFNLENILLFLIL